MNNFRFNSAGTIDCDVEHDVYGKIQTTLTETESREIIARGHEVSEYIENASINRDRLKSDLSSLDPSVRLLTDAILGDKWSISKLSEIEEKKKDLRGKLKLI